MNKNEVKVPTGQAQGTQMRFTEDELNLIRGVFGGNESLLKLMRKVFLPELDPNAPLGQMIDLWMSVPTKDTPVEQIAITLMARNSLIQHIDMQLLQLKALAGSETLTPEEAKAKVIADSTK